MDAKSISLYFMAFLYILAGVNHFTNTKMYMRIMPQYIPFHKPIVLLSGIIEIILGSLLMLPSLSFYAAWGVIALLIIIFPANVHHLTSSKNVHGTGRVFLILRLPLQAILIYWAYWHNNLAK